MRRSELWEKYDNKHKKVQEWTKRLSILPPLQARNKKWHMWQGKFMAAAGIKGYYFLLTGVKKIPEDDKDIT